MTQEELMVGDLVMFNNGVDKVQEIYGKVGNVYLQEYGTIEISRLSPIPLTAEILKKNGFEKTLDIDDTECYRYNNRAADGIIKITLHDGGDGDWSVEIVNYDKFNDSEIRYKNEFSFLKVHQLQHALRLCDINKEIEL